MQGITRAQMPVAIQKVAGSEHLLCTNGQNLSHQGCGGTHCGSSIVGPKAPLPNMQNFLKHLGVDHPDDTPFGHRRKNRPTVLAIWTLSPKRV